MDEELFSESDRQAIRRTALDYMQGWYEGDAGRMESSLHEILAKRSVRVDSGTGQDELWHISKTQMVEYTAGGGGKATPREKLNYEVTILDGYKEVDSVKVVAYDFIDYLHLAKVNGSWTIVNVIWSQR